METNERRAPGCLGCIGGETTQLYRDHNKPWIIGSLPVWTNQDNNCTKTTSRGAYLDAWFMVGSKMHSLHLVNASHGCQATRTHSTAWLTSKPTGNSWRPHGPVEVGWCLGWSIVSVSPWELPPKDYHLLGMIYAPLSLGNLFQILPMIWVAPSLISFLSFFSPSPVVLQKFRDFWTSQTVMSGTGKWSFLCCYGKA